MEIIRNALMKFIVILKGLKIMKNRGIVPNNYIYDTIKQHREQRAKSNHKKYYVNRYNNNLNNEESYEEYLYQLRGGML